MSQLEIEICFSQTFSKTKKELGRGYSDCDTKSQRDNRIFVIEKN